METTHKQNAYSLNLLIWSSVVLKLEAKVEKIILQQIY